MGKRDQKGTITIQHLEESQRSSHGVAGSTGREAAVASVLRILCVHAKSLQPCPILCNPMDSSPASSYVHEILQKRIREWVAKPSSRGSS